VTDFRFGRFELDLRARELRKDGVRLRLQDQPFEVLAILVEHPGEVITRDELRRRLWPDGTFVDFEHGLNAAVKRLRGALGDNADRPRFVETLHRRGYRFIARVERDNGGPAGSIAAVAGALQGKPRVAVLPFLDLSEGGALEFFASGLTEDLMTELGRLCADRLGIIARGSSMSVRRSGATIHEIGGALHAEYLVEGSVRAEAERVRITARLVETRGETQRWAESFERLATDSLRVQSEVSALIVGAVAAELCPDVAATRGGGTTRVDARQSYLKGLYHWHKPGEEGLREAIGFFEQARQLDPRFAAAHAAAGRAYLAAAEYYVLEPPAALTAARSAATRALDIDPSASEAYLTLAEVRRALDWDCNGAEEEFRRALAFNPSNEGAHRLFGVFLASLGRRREAVTVAERGCELDPLCLVINTGAAAVCYLSRQYGEAIERCRHTLDMDPRFAGTHRLLAAALLQAGRLDESLRQLESIPEERRDAASLACLAHARAVVGDIEGVTSLDRRLDELAGTRYVSAYYRAMAPAALGDFDRAFALLDRACDDRDPALTSLAVEPRFDVLRPDARYDELVDRLGLDLAPEASARAC
jgi:TolB-like protein/Tfp pilus assembly protein PilF